MWRIAVVLLSLLSLGQCAPLDNCETLLKPIPISHGDMLGRWLYIGGTSDLPGSRSLAHLLTSAWIESRPTSQSNILELIQAQRINGNCFTLKYNVTFENSTLLIESSFYLKEVYLPTESSDCLVIYETLSSENEAIKSLFLFSKNRTVSPAAVEMVKKQAECLQMPSLLMVDPNSEMCQEDPSPLEGLEALDKYLVVKFKEVIEGLEGLFMAVGKMFQDVIGLFHNFKPLI
ncbi:uncharacterized protein LOC117373246 isoform X1 [Periophthalmus magnuspinnatus]|uniref:uncharacterized protein LOC117373246 isoform X1 n=1 Tax=Periophthalmus magnuspinnatus TaxID=409849 RepID=UPI002436927C|nr:uncharacterized protein LOC117373246 isoform X1 [Periophthalmus magnuspinnatus]